MDYFVILITILLTIIAVTLLIVLRSAKIKLRNLQNDLQVEKEGRQRVEKILIEKWGPLRRAKQRLHEERQLRLRAEKNLREEKKSRRNGVNPSDCTKDN